jgi:glycosyltransferase involved in cell wall biosynthesis
MKKNITPLVSVVMTAFNASAFIPEALDSLISQTYSNLEFIIVNDGSTDSTWKIIQKYSKLDPRFHIFQLKKNSGCSVASNFAFRKAKGKYIARLDADDIAYPDRFIKQVEFMETHPQVVMLGGQCDIINEFGQLIGEKNFPLKHQDIVNALFSINPIQHPASMFRATTFKTAKIKYEPDLIISHDLKIVFQLLSFGHLANLPDKVISYRHRPNSLTHKNPKFVFEETLAIRNWAKNSGIYSPTATGLLVHQTETFLVSILPNKIIHLLFEAWRVRSYKFNWQPIFSALTTLILVKNR